MIHFAVYTAIALLTARTEPEQSVARGREALDRWWGGYPWYDSDTDGVKPVEVPKPSRADRNWDWTFDGFSPVVMEILQWTLWLIVAVVLLVVVFFLLRAYFRDGSLRWARRAKNSQGEADRRRRIEALPFPLKAAKLDFLAEARRYYQQGQYGEAVKYLFSYQLVELDRHRLLRLARGKTNRQYLREIAAGRRAGLGGLLQQTMWIFEDSFFGGHRIDRARFEACWSRIAEFEAQLKGEAG